jgi:hypothetical protein
MMDQRTAIQKINLRGILLVFPIKNAKEPSSLWSEFYPRSKMRWEWDENGDDKVSHLWFLMKKLSATPRVVYSKWYQNRATFFSRELFAALLTVARERGSLTAGLSRPARDILDLLESDSPLSTKQIKKMAELQGRDNEPRFQKAMKELFSRFLVVAYGEVDDGAFPSLAVGSTRLLFEDLWQEAGKTPVSEAWRVIDRFMPAKSKTRLHFEKSLARLKGDELGGNGDEPAEERSPSHIN